MKDMSKLRFDSDYMETCHPLILERLQKINFEKMTGYGCDEICESAKEKISKACDCPKAEIKIGLESLAGKIPGLLDIKVVTEGRLETSNADLMLDSSFESFDALKSYAIHPEHVKVADEKVRPFTANRSCLDFEVIL